MPGIFNVTNGYVNNTKKISSKLTFEVGEKFSGKIVKNTNGETSIKLLDGWEFSAEIEGDINNLENVFQRFTVEGYENGKLKLKVISKGEENSEASPKDFSKIILKEGLNQSDEKLLSIMTKFNIPLTKENIKEIKGMIQFLDKIQNSSEEIDKFILKYLETNGIDINTDKGKEAYNLLSKFFSEYSTLSNEDVLIFFENNIELNTENIEAYNKIFKQEEGIENIIKDISNIITNEDPDMGIEKLNSNISYLIDDNFEMDINNNFINSSINNSDRKSELTTEGKFANNIYQKNDGITPKVSILSLLKSISGEGEDILNSTLKDILNDRRSSFTKAEFEIVFSNINELEAKDFINDVKNIKREFEALEKVTYKSEFEEYLNKVNNEKLGIKEEVNLTKGQLEVLLSEKTGKNIKLTENEFSKLRDIINIKYQENEDININVYNSIYNKETTQNKDSQIGLKETTQSKDSQTDLKEIIQNKEVQTGLKEVIENKERQTELKEVTENKDGHTRIKEIIQNKDSQTDLKGITQNKEDQTGIKEVTENKEGQTGLKETIQNEDSQIGLKENIKEETFIKDIITSKEGVDKTVSTQEQVKNSLNKASEENKAILKDVINILKSDSDVSDKLLNLIKENVTKMKVFNKLSEEYYYANIPVNIKSQEYPCKIIVKDKRREGKKLDSKNLKLLVTIDTKNIGKVDGYLKVSEKKLDIDLKCDENYVKILNKGREKLSSSIESMGFSVNINIIKKEEEITLSTCRDFFNTGAKISLDRKV